MIASLRRIDRPLSLGLHFIVLTNAKINITMQISDAVASFKSKTSFH